MKRRAGYSGNAKEALNETVLKKTKLCKSSEKKTNTATSSKANLHRPLKIHKKIPSKSSKKSSKSFISSSEHLRLNRHQSMVIGHQVGKTSKDKSLPNRNMKFDVEMHDLADNISASNSGDAATALIYVVIDTNVYLEGDELKAVDSLIEWQSLPGKTYRRVIVVVPWVVLQELDYLKNNKSRMQKARRAVAFLNKRFCSKKPGIRGQTIIEAAAPIEGLRIEMEDDRILQCCFFFSNLPGNHKTFLFSKDNNLCSKAVVNHIDTLSTFTALVRRITALCGNKDPEFDKRQSMSNDEEVLENVSQEVVAVLHNASIDHNGNVETKIPADVDYNDAVWSVKSLVREALSYILKEEMVNAYGKDMWLEIILKKPPWSLKDVLFCIKKHWLAVFGVDRQDRLLQELVEKSLQYVKTSSYPPHTEKNSQGGRDATFVLCCLQLLRGLGKKYRKVELVKNTINKLQSTYDIFKSSPASRAPESGEKKDCKISADSPSPSFDGDVVFEDLDEDNTVSDEDSAIFWESLDEIWACIIGHCASIFKSLSFKVRSAPPELQSLLFTSSSSDLPDPSLSVKIMPLLIELISGFLAALERFLSSYKGGLSSPDLSLCFDMRQTLWMITKAFNMQSKVENIKPSTVLQSCKSNESRMKLCNGYSKLNCVAGLLRECTDRLVQMR